MTGRARAWSSRPSSVSLLKRYIERFQRCRERHPFGTGIAPLLARLTRRLPGIGGEDSLPSIAID